MTAESSTYTYESGTQETVTLSRGTATPYGHALLKITYSDGEIADCFVNTAWLRDRAEKLVQQRPEVQRDDWKARAEKAEQERDVARKFQRAIAKDRDQLRSMYEGQIEVIGRLQREAAEPRPLTPDDITDEMVTRFMLHEYGVSEQQAISDEWADDRNNARDSLVATLTEPTRPEGAYELETVIGCNAGKWTSGPEDVRALADLLASKGVRVMGAN